VAISQHKPLAFIGQKIMNFIFFILGINPLLPVSLEAGCGVKVLVM
jgi:hypothetical protein